MSGGFQRDAWLGGILGREAWRYAPATGDPGPAGREEKARVLGAKPVFVYAKVPVESCEVARAVEDDGFRLVDTNVQFDKPAVPGRGLAGNCAVRFAVPGDEGPAAELGRRAFRYSRFHLDRDIPSGTADAIKAEWVRNFFRGRRGQAMVIATAGEECVGFLQLLHGAEGALVIDLIGVDGAHRGKGIAADMIAFAEDRCTGFPRIVVGTQIANVPSLRLYERLGFRVRSAGYVFHYHNL